MPTADARGQRVRLTIIEPWRNGPQHAVSLSEFMVLQGARHRAIGAVAKAFRSGWVQTGTDPR